MSSSANQIAFVYLFFIIKWIKVNEATFAKFAKNIFIVLFLLPQVFRQS